MCFITEKQESTLNKYRCPACKKIIERDRDEERVKSFCSKTGREVWMELQVDTCRPDGGRDGSGVNF